MSISRMLKRIGAAGVILAAFTTNAFAATCWFDNAYPSNGEATARNSSCVHASAAEACSHMITQPSFSTNSTYNFSVTGYQQTTAPNGYQCTLTATPKAGGSPNATISPRDTLASYTYTGPICSIPAGQQVSTIMATPNSSGVIVDNGSYCYNSCQINTQGVGLTISSASASSPSAGTIIYTSTGAVCSANTPPPASTGAQCVVINGQSVCDVVGQPCVRINGDLTCSQDLLPPSDHTAKQLPSGAVVTNTATPAPPAPDNGTPNQIATPSLTLNTNTSTNTSNHTTNNYYDKPTVDKSSKGAPCPSGQITNGDGSCSATGYCPTGTSKNAAGQCISDNTANCGGSGQPACQVEPSCGITGKPACNVKIDESGMPALPQFTHDPDDKTNEISNIARTSPLSGLNLPSSTSYAMPNGTCQSITSSFSFRGTHTYTFPSASGCARIEIFKTILAWCIGLVTFVYCLRRFINEI
jgi:hypothetical protein